MTPHLLAVTTAARSEPDLEDRARHLAAELNAPYAPRGHRSLPAVFAETGAHRLLIVGADALRLRDAGGVEYAYHPNMLVVRGGNLARGQRDQFADATQLAPGERILDCTLGFGTEATLAALLTGETGLVVGLEAMPALATVTREGMRTFDLPNRALRAAMRRVNVVTADYRDYLPRCASHAFDVVYFDPFFDDRLPGSETNVSPLAHFGSLAPLDAPSVLEARRVARRRVVIKHPRAEPLPDAVAAEVAQDLSTRHSRLVYSILTAF